MPILPSPINHNNWTKVNKFVWLVKCFNCYFYDTARKEWHQVVVNVQVKKILFSIYWTFGLWGDEIQSLSIGNYFSHEWIGIFWRSGRFAVVDDLALTDLTELFILWFKYAGLELKKLNKKIFSCDSGWGRRNDDNFMYWPGLTGDIVAANDWKFSLTYQILVQWLRKLNNRVKFSIFNFIKLKFCHFLICRAVFNPQKFSLTYRVWK